MQKGSMIGKGMTAEVYEWGQDKVLKLFFDWFPKDLSEYEAEIGRAIYEAGVPAPAVYGVVDENGRSGILYERIYGNSMLGHIGKKPWKTAYFARQMAQLHTKIHHTTANRLPLQKEKLSEAIRHSKGLLGNKTEKIVEHLYSLPDGMSVCHGDFHPDNIFVTGEGLVAIDWTNAYSGNPLGDVARTGLMIRSPFLSPGTSPIIAMLSKNVKQWIYTAYLKEYTRLAKVSNENIDAWTLPIAAARLREKLPGEEKWLLGIIDECLSVT